MGAERVQGERTHRTRPAGAKDSILIRCFRPLGLSEHGKILRAQCAPDLLEQTSVQGRSERGEGDPDPWPREWELERKLEAARMRSLKLSTLM